MIEPHPSEPKFLIVVGASAGGLNTVIELMAQVTEEMDAAILVVMHSPAASFADVVLARLLRNSVFTCKLAEHNEPIRRGYCYLAVPDRHLIVKRGVLLLGQGAVENRWRPSIDVLFRSAAVAYNGRTIGVILTGLLEDGTAGMQIIKECGGTCIVQDPAEAEYPNMPRSVLRSVAVDYCTSLQRIAVILQEKARNGVNEPAAIPAHIAKEAAIAERVAIGIEEVRAIGGTQSAYSCPECGGATWETRDGNITRYRCHTGHVFTAGELFDRKRKELENTFWVTLRILEERRSLLLKMAEEEAGKGWGRSAAAKQQRAQELEVHIGRIKELLFSATAEPNSAAMGPANPGGS